MARPKSDNTEDYDEFKRKRAEIQAATSKEGRDIGDIPEVVDPGRKAKGRASLEFFALAYFPGRFPLPFSDDHKAAIRKFEQTSEHGGKFALGMPRGSGKTTLAEVDAIRDAVYGIQPFHVIIQGTEDLAGASLKRIKEELETNELLLEDFPEVCIPIRKLERIAHRAKGQLYKGKPTYIEWRSDYIALARIDNHPSSGAIISTVGITGSVRGMSVTINGKTIRPTKVTLDDCQTRESAYSPTQTIKRMDTINADVLGLAGPTVEISAVMLCTVICKGDMADQYLSREKSPQWDGQKTKMLPKFPDNLEIWDEYQEVRRAAFLDDTDKHAAPNAFYEAHREEMERGAVVSWKERKKTTELTALQSAMNLYYDNPKSFFAEYQNEPIDGGVGEGGKELHPDAIAARFIGSERYQLPPDTTRLTAFIDAGKKVLWYAVIAWNEQFGGTIVDYGPYPKQNRSFFSADDARPTLSDTFPHLKKDNELVFAGLAALTSDVLGRTYYYANGQTRNVERCLIDSGWETDAVKQFCRRSEHRAILSPSKGIARTTSAKGIQEWAAKPGERKGHHWRLSVQDKLLQFDPDAWKSILHGMLLVHAGGKGGLWLYGTSANAHEMLAHHLSAEYSQSVTIRGSTFDKWEVKPYRPDNHLLDCVVGATVAASVTGLQFSASGAPEVVEKKRRKTFAELEAEVQARAR